MFKLLLPLFYLVVLSGILYSCKKDEDPEPEPGPSPSTTIDNILLSGGGTVSFSRKWDGPDADAFYGVWPCADSGFVCIGFTESEQAVERDILLIRTNPDGTERWRKMYDYGFTDIGLNVIEYTGGGLIISGTKSNSTGNSSQGLVFATDASGTVEWEQSFDFGNNTEFNDMKLTDDGNLMIVGIESTSGNAFILKINPSGSELWRKSWGGNCVFNSIANSIDGGYMLAGSIVNSSTNELDALLLRVTSTGDTVWMKQYDRPGNDMFRSIVGTNLGYYFVCGYGSQPAGGTVTMITDLGGEIWWRDLQGFGISDINTVALSPGDRFLLGGHGSPAGTQQAFLFEMDEVGNVSWFKNYNPGSVSSIKRAWPTPDDGFVAAGYILNGGNSSGYLLKTDGDGN